MTSVAFLLNVITKATGKLTISNDVARGADIATDTLNSTSKLDDIVKIVDDPINYADDVANSLDNISEIAGSKSGVIEGEGAENVNKGVAVIVQDGKIQSMMPTALKDFLKLK